MESQIKLLLIGGGGHCRACIDVIRSTNKYDIIGILDLTAKVGGNVDGVPIIGTDDDITEYLPNVDQCLITVGQIGNGSIRKRLYEQVLEAAKVLSDNNDIFATVYSPRSHVSPDASVAMGSIVMHDVVVNAGAEIAENVILNTMSLVEHDAKIGSHTHISTRATVNGDASIGSESFVGSNAVIFNQCIVGDSSIIGGGQIVRQNVDSKARPKHVKRQATDTFIIAEAGVNHNGDINNALKMIEVAARAGADAVKFQTFRAEALTTNYAEKAQYQKHNTEQSESQQQMLKALELPESAYQQLVEHCESLDIEFMSTAFDERSMDFLIDLGIKRIKIPSGELTNVPFVRHCAGKDLPVILSTGMATQEEVDSAISVILTSGLAADKLSVLQCNTAYPTPFEDANLNCIKTFAEGSVIGQVGYSDHTLGDEAIIASVALGARIVEKHFTLDRSLPGPDQLTSLEPDELKALVTKIRHIERALGDGIKQPSESEIENIAIARKSIVASADIKQGEVFNETNLTTKRPATGISAANWDDVIGCLAKRDFAADELIEL